ncbi:hypothetical protein [Kitasatospora camelliae]|uniref:Integral membrane protein n=1 Tax=Kitasatospora camelliae TaxID=3156397 RepID=A0AAU8JQJ8_9ACTN
MNSSPEPAAGPTPGSGSRRLHRPSHTDYGGAVYGSLLAASVVATAGSTGGFPRLQLAVMLVVTGLVFWAAHVYAHLAGNRQIGQQLNRREVRYVAAHEWSIVEASLFPALAVVVSPLLGLGLEGATWLALSVAVAQQVTWALIGAVKSGASRGQAATEGLVNLVLGLVIIAAKAALHH